MAMPKYKLKPDIISYNSLIYAYGKAKEFSSCNKVLNRMIASGLVPNERTYNTLISIWRNQIQAAGVKAIWRVNTRISYVHGVLLCAERQQRRNFENFEVCFFILSVGCYSRGREFPMNKRQNLHHMFNSILRMYASMKLNDDAIRYFLILVLSSLCADLLACFVTWNYMDRLLTNIPIRLF
jgi:pentatricopeptide repeat protein